MQKIQITKTGPDSLFISGLTEEKQRRVIAEAEANESAPAPFEMVTRIQTAKLCQVHPNSLKRWEKSGKLRPIKITARCLRYNKAEVLAMLGGVTV